MEQEKKYVKEILESYQTKEETKFDQLKKLDRKVKLPAKVFAYLFGSISCLILGFGMCVAMKIILGNLMWVGILIGLVGIFMITINYFIYTKILNCRKEKFKVQVQELSEELLNN